MREEEAHFEEDNVFVVGAAEEEGHLIVGCASSMHQRERRGGSTRRNVSLYLGRKEQADDAPPRKTSTRVFSFPDFFPSPSCCSLSGILSFNAKSIRSRTPSCVIRSTRQLERVVEGERERV
jgi:hypothetical protein